MNYSGSHLETVRPALSQHDHCSKQHKVEGCVQLEYTCMKRKRFLELERGGAAACAKQSGSGDVPQAPGLQNLILMRF